MNRVLFEQAKKWQLETFPNSTAITSLKHLQKEIKKELLVVLKDPNPEVSNDQIAEEYADCFLLLFDSAHRFGLTWNDINEAIENKLVKNKNRTWNKPNKKGFTEHKK